MREEVDNRQGRAERESQGVLRHIRGEGGGGSGLVHLRGKEFPKIFILYINAQHILCENKCQQSLLLKKCTYYILGFKKQNKVISITMIKNRQTDKVI